MPRTNTLRVGLLLGVAAFCSFASLDSNGGLVFGSNALSRPSTGHVQSRARRQVVQREAQTEADELMARLNPTLRFDSQSHDSHREEVTRNEIARSQPRGEWLSASSYAAPIARARVQQPSADELMERHNAFLHSARGQTHPTHDSRAQAYQAPQTFDPNCPEARRRFENAASPSSGLVQLASISRSIATQASQHPQAHDRNAMCGAGLEASVRRYSESPMVRRIIDYAMPRARQGSRNSRRLCFRYVKEALCQGTGRRCPSSFQDDGLVDGYLGGRLARQAGPELQQQGFVDLLQSCYGEYLQDPRNAPVGAILVYEGGSRNQGHIEIRTPDGFVSDYFDERPITETRPRNGRGHRLIGVYFRPN